MLGLTSHHKFYIYTKATDMRKGYNGLSGIVSNEIGQDPTNGKVYVFFNRSRHLMKMLVWDHDGFVIYAKKLEKGTFEKISTPDSSITYSIAYEQLVMLISGISLKSIKSRTRYSLSKAI